MINKLAVYIALLCPCGLTLAGDYCSIMAPTLRKESAAYRLVIPVTCADTKTGSAVKYPGGRLYVGATLYRLDPRVRGKVSPLKTSKTSEGTDLPAVELTGRPVKRELVLDAGPHPDATHVVVAVWDKKNPCSAETENPGCAKFGYTLGRIDDQFEMPIPVDAWPRPICNKAALVTSGFFEWVESAGDPSGMNAPEWANEIRLNDCWSSVQTDGLGYSIRRWRAGPINIPE